MIVGWTSLLGKTGSWGSSYFLLCSMNFPREGAMTCNMRRARRGLPSKRELRSAFSLPPMKHST